MPAKAGTPTIARFIGGLMVTFPITVSGNYAAGGDTLALPYIPGCNAVPQCVDIFSTKASGVSGEQYAYSPGTTQANGLFQVLYQNGTTGPLVDAGALTPYPATITGDTITAIAFFLGDFGQ